jgi:hypothetical protein
LLRLDGQHQAAFGPDFQARGDRVADVDESSIAGFALADATGDGGAFGDPNTVLVPLKCGQELQARQRSCLARFWKARRFPYSG